MFADFGIKKVLIRIAVLAIAPLFAACGGGGGDDSSSSDNNDEPGINPIACIIVILATGQTECTEGGGSAPSPPPSAPPPPSSTPPSSDGAALVLRPNEEFEPNNEFANANLPSSPTRQSADQEIGWYLDGSIDDVNDTTDTFAFTPNQTRQFNLALCPPQSSICYGATGIDTITAFFRVQDQDGNVLLTSQADTVEGNSRQITLDAGVLYYVTVEAGDTMGVIVAYRLYVYESS